MSINSPKDVLYVLHKGRTMQCVENSWDNFFFFFVQIICLLAVFYQLLTRYLLLSTEEAKM